MIFAKTEAGQLAHKARSDLLSVRQRSVFLLFDGVKPVDRILKLTAALNITQDDVDALVTHGFIAAVGATADAQAVLPGGETTVTAVTAAEAAQTNMTSPQQRFAVAWPLATQLAAGLGLRGFRLNLSIEKASGFDALLALLPKIQDAVGAEKCSALTRALKS